jgi:hypothetical protein
VVDELPVIFKFARPKIVDSIPGFKEWTPGVQVLSKFVLIEKKFDLLVCDDG